MSGARQALVVEDEPASRDALATLVGHRGVEVRTAGSVKEARALLAAEPALDLAFVDLGLPDGDGMDLIAEVVAGAPGCAVVVITGERRLERAVEAMRRGASDFLSKPLEPRVLELTLDRLGRHLDDRDEQRRLRRELMAHGTYQGMVGRSAPIRRVFEQVERVAPSGLPTFILGESGTGKELLAHAIHAVSRRRAGPFIAVNCGAIPHQLAESELFGHERGAFTGAVRSQPGAFERADGGTLFLDEVTEMPLDIQVTLLRVLETGRIQRVGGQRELNVDVRMVCATNRDPEEAVREGRFREDLFYRLHVIPIALPPLRERRDDIPLLARHLLADLARQDKARITELSADTLAALAAHAWPGNVRELRNTLARASVLALGEAIEPEDLGLQRPSAGRRVGDGGAPLPPAPDRGTALVRIPLEATLADAERLLIEASLTHHGGHRGKTARALGIAPKTLYNKCKAYGIGR